MVTNRCVPLFNEHIQATARVSHVSGHIWLPQRLRSCQFSSYVSRAMGWFFIFMFCADQRTNNKVTWQAHWFYCNFKSWEYFILYIMHHIQGNHRGERVICFTKGMPHGFYLTLENVYFLEIPNL